MALKRFGWGGGEGVGFRGLGVGFFWGVFRVRGGGGGSNLQIQLLWSLTAVMLGFRDLSFAAFWS